MSPYCTLKCIQGGGVRESENFSPSLPAMKDFLYPPLEKTKRHNGCRLGANCAAYNIHSSIHDLDLSPS